MPSQNGMIKKAVIMAAGRGARMLHMTDDLPKVLTKVNGQPFLFYLLEHLRRAGIEEIGLIVGYKKELIAEYLKKEGLRATLIEQKEQLGTGDAVKQAADFVGNGPFLCLAGDHLWSIEDIQRAMHEDEYSHITGMHSKTPERYGVLFAKGEYLNQIVEKPKEHVGNLVNISLYKFTPEIFDALKQIQKSPRGEYEITDAINILAAKGLVKINVLKDYWIDLGSIEDLPDVRKMLSKYKVH